MSPRQKRTKRKLDGEELESPSVWLSIGEFLGIALITFAIACCIFSPIVFGIECRLEKSVIATQVALAKELDDKYNTAMIEHAWDTLAESTKQDILANIEEIVNHFPKVEKKDQVQAEIIHRVRNNFLSCDGAIVDVGKWLDILNDATCSLRLRSDTEEHQLYLVDFQGICNGVEYPSSSKNGCIVFRSTPTIITDGSNLAIQGSLIFHYNGTVVWICRPYRKAANRWDKCGSPITITLPL